MSNFIQEILNKLKENEKELLINKSGSTKTSSNEKIRSGQSYLYKIHGMESEVFEVRFKKTILGSILNRALNETMVRYPYFNTKLLEKDGDFYIVQNELSLIAKKTEKLHNLGSINCGYHLLDITYYNCSIYISFHHALCDGRGIKPFIETLIYYYCLLKYNSNASSNGIRLSSDELLPDETKDPFLTPYSYNEKEFPSFSRDAFHLDENKKVESTRNYRYEITISESDTMSVCKNNNATPVILISLAMQKAIAEIYPNFNKPINANVATDMREALGCQNTFKNCVKSMILPFTQEIQSLSLEQQSTKFREYLNAQRDIDYSRKEANSMLQLFDKLDTLTSYKEKQSIMSFFESMILDTFIVSYIGKFAINENEKYIDSIHLYNSGTAKLGINMIACCGKFIIDIKQNFISNKYVNAFIKQLENLNLKCISSEVIEFETPTDHLIKRKKEPKNSNE